MSQPIPPIKQHCECPDEGSLAPGMASWYDSETELPFVKHEPGKCLCTNRLKQYRRGNKVLTLCSCCNLNSLDVEISEQVAK